MRVRLSGARAELAAAVDSLAAVFELREVSDFYPNRGAGALGRVYLDVEPDQAPDAGPVRAGAGRADPSGRAGPRPAPRRGGDRS
ncbi:MAG: hypothetical protein ACRDT0_02510 [Pseudonocardiaceae bacterium]